AEAYGLAIAGINNGNNTFGNTYGGLSIGQFAAAFSALTDTSTAAITQFVNNWIAFFTAHPEARPGLSVTLAAYGAAAGDAIGVALEANNATALSLQALVANALFDVAQTGVPGGATYTAGVPIGSLPQHTPFQGAGQTFILTVTQDTFAGNGNDLILGPKAGIFGNQATLTDFDSLIFTGPNNQLIAAFDGDHTAAGVTITGIPKWFFQ